MLINASNLFKLSNSFLSSHKSVSIKGNGIDHMTPYWSGLFQMTYYSQQNNCNDLIHMTFASGILDGTLRNYLKTVTYLAVTDDVGHMELWC